MGLSLIDDIAEAGRAFAGRATAPMLSVLAVIGRPARPALLPPPLWPSAARELLHDSAPAVPARESPRPPSAPGSAESPFLSRTRSALCCDSSCQNNDEHHATHK